MTKTGGRPYHEYIDLADRWHPLCPLCKEKVDCNRNEQCTNRKCDAYGWSIGRTQLWLIATSSREKS